MDMEQELYTELFYILDCFTERRSRVSLHSLHAGGMIGASRGLRAELEKFERAVAARAKAEFEDAKCTIEQVASDFGDEFAAIEVDSPRRCVHPKRPKP